MGKFGGAGGTWTMLRPCYGGVRAFVSAPTMFGGLAWYACTPPSRPILLEQP